MADICLKIESVDEMRALLRAIVASKFTQSLSDPEVLTSKFVARIASELLELVRTADSEKWGESVGDRWATWATMDPSRPEWDLALNHCASYLGQRWLALSAADQVETVRVIFSPFRMADGYLQRFCSLVGVAVARTAAD